MIHEVRNRVFNEVSNKVIFQWINKIIIPNFLISLYNVIIILEWLTAREKADIYQQTSDFDKTYTSYTVMLTYASRVTVVHLIYLHYYWWLQEYNYLWCICLTVPVVLCSLFISVKFCDSWLHQNKEYISYEAFLFLFLYHKY